MNCFNNNKILCLLADNKEYQVDMKVTYECKAGEKETVVISVVYEGKSYHGYGHEHLGIEAFADLQRKLPQGVEIKCCLSCKHGNQCPVGDFPNELFCTKDVDIKQVGDLWFYTEDNIERQTRKCSYANVCDEWKEQELGCFVYNDFYHLK